MIDKIWTVGIFLSGFQSYLIYWFTENCWIRFPMQILISFQSSLAFLSAITSRAYLYKHWPQFTVFDFTCSLCFLSSTSFFFRCFHSRNFLRFYRLVWSTSSSLLILSHQINYFRGYFCFWALFKWSDFFCSRIGNFCILLCLGFILSFLCWIPFGRGRVKT